MNEDRLMAALRTLDAPVDPDPAFADRLFDDLAEDLGFRPQGSLAGLVQGARLAFGWRRSLVEPRALRIAYVAAVGALLAAGMIVALMGAALLLQQRPSAPEIVRSSQALYVDGTAPAFTMTLRLAGGSVDRFSWDGAGALRIDAINGMLLGEVPGEGSWMLATSSGLGIFNADRGTWSQGLDTQPSPIWRLPLAWIPPVHVEAGGTAPMYTCDDWQLEPDEVILGRSVHHVTCAEKGFWIDTETLLLLRRDVPGLTEEPELIGFEPRVTLSPEAFVLEAPVGAHNPNDPATKLVVGEPPPEWTGAYLDGRALDLGALEGPVAIYFWASWCPPCQSPGMDDVAVVAADWPEVTTIALAYADEYAPSYLAEHPTDLTVAVDPDGLLGPTWGLAGIPTLVLIDADGRVAGIRGPQLSRPELETMYMALAEGRPIPTAVPTLTSSPQPVPTPGPS